MLTRLELIFNTAREDMKRYQAPLFHGWLMEQLGTEAAEWLHEENIRPYAQYLYFDGENWRWRLQTLNRAARERMIEPLLEKNIREIRISHRDKQYPVKGYMISEQTYGKLFEKYYIEGEDAPYISLRIITPMAFKSGGRYVRFPEPHFVFQSLLNRFDAFSETMAAGDEGLLEAIDTQIYVGNYRLQGSSFPLEQIRVPAFKGEVAYKVTGNKQFVHMMNMLAAFGEYSGIGVKTALGMGAVVIKRKGEE